MYMYEQLQRTQYFVCIDCNKIQEGMSNYREQYFVCIDCNNIQVGMNNYREQYFVCIDCKGKSKA